MKPRTYFGFSFSSKSYRNQLQTFTLSSSNSELSCHRTAIISRYINTDRIKLYQKKPLGQTWFIPEFKSEQIMHQLSLILRR